MMYNNIWHNNKMAQKAPATVNLIKMFLDFLSYICISLYLFKTIVFGKLTISVVIEINSKTKQTFSTLVKDPKMPPTVSPFALKE